MFLALLLVGLLVLPGCLGGGSGSTSVSKTEIRGLFDEFVEHYKAMDTDKLAELFSFPVVVIYEDPDDEDYEFEAEDSNDLIEALYGEFDLLDAVECTITVENVTGTTTSAYASIIMRVRYIYTEGDDEAFEVEARFALTKKSGKWRITSMRFPEME